MGETRTKIIIMKQFILNMLSSSDDISHKRVIAIVSLVVVIVLAFMSAYGHTVDQSFIYLLGSLIGGESALTVIEKFKKP